ncbi:tRNA splicing endonuclease-like protein subunit [Phyllosticta citrichinensis]
MSDIDEEDVPQISNQNAEQIDLSDETQDFRFLSSLSITENGTSGLPKRGEKDFEPHSTSLQASALEASRLAMHAAISTTRIHNPKNHVLATYDPVSNMAYVDSIKGQAFRTVGKYVDGKMALFPEEMLYLLERGSLDVRWPAAEDEAEGLPMSLQGAYATCLGMEEAIGGNLTMERYVVYAGLKRSGYIVTRAESWDGTKVLNRGGEVQQSSTLGLFGSLWRRIFGATSSTKSSLGPLVSPGLYRNIGDVYRLLEVIPFHDPTAAAEFSPRESSVDPFHIAYLVYKPSPGWKKSNPGPPDFRVSVINARETAVPAVHQLNDLLACTPYQPPPNQGHVYQKVKHGYRNVIIAVVDQGIVSYIRVADAGFGHQKLYESTPRSAAAKRGGIRGRGRGGGRGRGRGRGR